MSNVEEIEARIMNLPRQDLAKLRDWFLDLDDRVWDEQIAADSRAGRLKGFIDKASEELAQGKVREL